jgi:hypothetical protein
VAPFNAKRCLSRLLLIAALLFQSPALPQPETFLRQQLGATSVELGALEKGQILVRLPKTAETREVAAFAIMRLDVSADFFVEKVRDIVTFKKSDNVLQIGKFSNPPVIGDLSGLTLDQDDIDSLRRCRVNSCDLKMSARYIDRFRKEINWTAPSYRESVTRLAKEMLLDNVQEYLKGGNPALGEYNDKSYALRLSDEFKSLLQPAAYMYGYSPEFQKYLTEFPASRPTGVEDYVYWSKEKFGLKPVISLTHISIYKQIRPYGAEVLIGSKGIYATHYYETSLGLTGFIQSQSSSKPHSYLIYINRSRTDALRGLFAGFKRSLIGGSLRDGARKNMELIKTKLEGEYAKLLTTVR